jgi:RimJ/RimL family protein N-acetyltransferase
MLEAIEESRAQISPWMGWLHPEYQLQDAENWVARAISAWNEQTAFEFVVYDTTDGRFAGCCGLNQINRLDLVCNLGYWIRTSKVRLGAATEAVALLQELAFGELGLNRLEIVVGDGNQGSRAVAEKAGAVYEGLQRRRSRVGKKIHDAHMYALINPALG